MPDYTPNWPRVRERYEAFWRGDAMDRPIIQATAPRPDASPRIPEDSPPKDDPDQLLKWFTDPERVIPRLRRQVERTHYAGDAFPLVFPVSPSLVAIQAAYLGGEYGLASGTAWCKPTIEDWGARPLFAVDPENPWWAASKRLLQEGAQAMEGVALVGIPDLQGGGQILDLLRGTERLALDLLEYPYEIHQALREIDDTWLEYWKECNNLLLPYQQGYVDWLGVWSARPAVTVECDFSIMISPEMFREFFLPAVQWQTERVERTIYHLDGEGAVRHLDALLALDSLTGVQWVPGAGAKLMAEWLPLLKRIQDAGKRLVIGCRADEVAALRAELKPTGLLLGVHCRSADEADSLAG